MANEYGAALEVESGGLCLEVDGAHGWKTRTDGLTWYPNQAEGIIILSDSAPCP